MHQHAGARWFIRFVALGLAHVALVADATFLHVRREQVAVRRTSIFLSSLPIKSWIVTVSLHRLDAPTG
jgi:hypothetical protein